MDLVGIVLPALIYCFYLILSPLRRSIKPKGKIERRSLLGSAVAAALLSGIFLSIMMSAPGPWRDRTQLAWVGIERNDNRPLALGNTSDSSINSPNQPDASSMNDSLKDNPGWPAGQTSPEVHFEASGNGTNCNASHDPSVCMTAKGGGGFILDQEDTVLYGHRFAGPVQIGDYTLNVEPKGIWPRRYWQVSVSDPANGNSLLMTEGSHPEGHVSASEMSVIDLSGVMDVPLRRMRASGYPLAWKLAAWSEGIRILLHPGRTAYYLIPGESPDQPVPIRAGSVISVRWPHLPMSARVEIHNGKPRLVFLPPFRHSSPLPPDDAQNAGIASLTVAGRMSPGAKVFLLPLHGAERAFEGDLFIVNGRFQSADGKGASNQANAQTESYARFPGVTSSVAMDIGQARYYLDTIRDIPDARRLDSVQGADERGRPFSATVLPLCAFVFLAWVIFVFHAYLVYSIPPDSLSRSSLSFLYGIVVVVWAMLCVRLALAFRFAANPSLLDDLGLRGMYLSLTALIVIPASLMLVAKINRKDKRPHWVPTLASCLLLTAMPFLMSGCLILLWPILGKAYFHRLHLFWDEAYLAVPGFCCLVLAVVSRLQLQPDSGWRERFLFRCGNWVNSPHEMSTKAIEWAQKIWAGRWRKVFLVAGVVLFVFIFCAGLVTRVASASLFGLGKEVLAALYQLFSIAILLSADDGVLEGFRSQFAGGPVRFIKALLKCIVLSTLLIFLPFFVIPYLAFDDPGGIYAGLAFLLPCLVVMYFRRRRRILLATAILAGLGCSAIALIWMDPSLLLLLPKDRPYARVLLTRLPSNEVQSMLPMEPAYEKDQRSREQELSDADAHRWANRRMIQIGRWWGVGFRNARSQKSGIPQNTLQDDSTYAFYIASEHGAAGGMALVALGLMPLALLLAYQSGQSDFSARIALACIILAAFLVETLVQMAMNMGLIPTTGRSIPLLAVHSASNLFRWLVLLAISIVLLLMKELPDPPARPDSSWLRRLRIGGFLCAGLAVLALPILAVKATEDDPSTYTRAEERAAMVRAAVQRLKYNPSTHLLELTDSDQTGDSIEGTALQQEVTRFNQLPDDAKVEDIHPHNEDLGHRGNAGNRVASPHEFDDVRSRDEYLNKRMENWREADRKTASIGRPPMLMVIASENEIGGTTDYTIAENPAFNTRVNLDSVLKGDNLPNFTWRDGLGGSWVLSGAGFHIRVSDRQGSPAESSRVVLTHANDKFSADVDNPMWSNVDVTFLCQAPSTGSHKMNDASPTTPLSLSLHLTPRGVDLSSTGVPLTYSAADSGGSKPLNGQIRFGNNVALKTVSPLCGFRRPSSFTLTRSGKGQLVGYAWSQGEWVATYDSSSHLPWLATLADALRASQENGKPLKFGSRISLDHQLQMAAEDFVADHGRSRQEELIEGKVRIVVPPRVGLSIFSVPSGEILALGGWPRTSPDDDWEDVLDEAGHRIDLFPPERWLESRVPGPTLASKYLEDKNFQLQVVGSSSKPIWAAASLSVNPGLSALKVIGNGRQKEYELFGIPVVSPANGWQVTPSTPWINFTCYLSHSDNRFQVELNFLALAARSSTGATGIGKSDTSMLPCGSFTGGAPARNSPDLHAFGFTASTPRTLHGVESSDLATAMAAHYPVLVDSRQVSRRLSLWTGNELDDWVGTAAEYRGLFGKGAANKPESYTLTGQLGWWTPTIANVSLDKVQSPRDFVSILLGGSTNEWSNVDLPSAVYTAVVGRPVIPHLGMDLDEAKKQTNRIGYDPRVTSEIQGGLQDVIANGTASSQLGHGALDIRGLFGPEYSFYAKTGTLAPQSGLPQTARIVLLIVHWSDSRRTAVDRGMVLSMYVEHGGFADREANKAAQWMGEFVRNNKELIANQLK